MGGGFASERARSAWLRPTTLLLLLSSLPGVARADGGHRWFTDVTEQTGVGYVQQVPREPPACSFDLGGFCEPERMTGGAAVGDVDGDGDLDLLVTRYGDPDLLLCNQLEQTGKARFADCTPGSGLEAFALQSNGAAFADVDRDGDLDLYVGTLGERDGINERNYLFINDGTGRFSEQAVARGADAADDIRRIWSIGVGDYDRDGWTDLHFTEWLPLDASNSRLLRNTGAGHFEDVTGDAGLAFDAVHGFASSFADLDGDLWPDLVVAADFSSSRLFWNQGDGTFLDGTAAANVGTDENGMGSALGDFDGDGDLDWFVTSILDPQRTCLTEPCGWAWSGNRLYRNDGDRSFTDVTDAFGVRDGRWGWGAAFLDFDNDADLDLVMTNGVDFPGISFETPFNDDPVRLWRNVGAGPWPESAAELGLGDTGSGKGLLVWDYDADGDLDLLIVNNVSGARLYRNERGSENAWLRVRVLERHAGGDALGARVELLDAAGGVAQVRQIGADTGFLGQSERTAHFGLGPAPAPALRVRVVWPNGNSLLLEDVAPRSVRVVSEPRPVPLGIRGVLLWLLLLLPVARALTVSMRESDPPRGRFDL